MRKERLWSWLIQINIIITMMICGTRGALLQSTMTRVGVARSVKASGTISNVFSESTSRIQTVHPHYNKHRTILFSTVKDSRNEQRLIALKEAMIDLGLLSRIDVSALGEAASVSSVKGYDGRFGKSAIKTYQSFLKSNKLSDDNLSVDAIRCARQIDFLLKRHASHDADWVRHSDDNSINNESKAISRKVVHPLIIVLDNVRSALNVGSIFRTSDACALAMVITTGITPHPNGPGATKLAKSALGAQYVLPHQHFDTTQQAIDFLIQSNYHLVGLETTKLSRDLYNSQEVLFPPKTALILGNEVTGVDTQILQQMDSLVEIPMYGSKNSLNIA
eukprot:CAMPEP_0194372682 /NCGR_PEP_ID=MMETSP0174-20130528/21077_1 /TAXON_ID=216777 /ORGANISM="Proboscia alata, Strain PI-D3" /LENGTH=333 /DNA_ID=CAMNT_0039151345 /DNA_START=31 /DNA_END=1029 /DNA_ORIENTATION=-